LNPQRVLSVRVQTVETRNSNGRGLKRERGGSGCCGDVFDRRREALNQLDTGVLVVFEHPHFLPRDFLKIGCFRMSPGSVVAAASITAVKASCAA
jgi:hypothetical protein